MRDNTEFYADVFVKQLKAGDTMTRFFKHERRETDTYRTTADVYNTELEINKYSADNNLEIASISCKEDKGVFVVFRKKA